MNSIVQAIREDVRSKQNLSGALSDERLSYLPHVNEGKYFVTHNQRTVTHKYSSFEEVFELPIEKRFDTLCEKITVTQGSITQIDVTSYVENPNTGRIRVVIQKQNIKPAVKDYLYAIVQLLFQGSGTVDLDAFQFSYLESSGSRITLGVNSSEQQRINVSVENSTSMGDAESLYLRNPTITIPNSILSLFEINKQAISHRFSSAVIDPAKLKFSKSDPMKDAFEYNLYISYKNDTLDDPSVEIP